MNPIQRVYKNLHQAFGSLYGLSGYEPEQDTASRTWLLRLWIGLRERIESKRGEY